jgi:hypothetical protein
MNTEQILEQFELQGFYCSSRRIQRLCPGVSAYHIDQAIIKARKLGLINRDTYLTRQLREAERNARIAEQLKIDRLIEISFK